ncbi:hypothetical protein GFM13_33340 [Rhizobium leguminosarum bv. viciae]|nr:hypothetical protein [Rhizobium leguminosarum bv. viciae]
MPIDKRLLSLVLRACPEMVPFGPGGTIGSWREMMTAPLQFDLCWALAHRRMRRMRRRARQWGRRGRQSLSLAFLSGQITSTRRADIYET